MAGRIRVGACQVEPDLGIGPSVAGGAWVVGVKPVPTKMFEHKDHIGIFVDRRE